MTKNIGIYLYDLRHPHVGLSEFDDNIARRIAERAKVWKEQYDIRFTFIVPQYLQGHYGPRVDYVVLTHVKAFWLNHVPALTSFPRFDLLHLTQQQPVLRRRLAPRVLLTIHDVNFFHNGLRPADVRRKAARIDRMLRVATHLSYISQFTQQDIHQHFPVTQPERVIRNGVTRHDTLSAHQPSGQLPAKYLLVLSGWDSKKNVDEIVAMMSCLPDRQLVVAGNGKAEDHVRLQAIINRLHLTNVTLLGRVSEAEKSWLYQHCEAFLFTSRSEGFGLPPAEAMTCGKPVFLSQSTSLPEVGGEAAFYFPDLTPETMAATLRDGLAQWYSHEDEHRQAVLTQVAQFNWDDAVEAYLHYYLDILRCK